LLIARFALACAAPDTDRAAAAAIHEIAPAVPTGDWIELYNPHELDVVLDGGSIAHVPTVDAPRWTLPIAGTVPAGGYLALGVDRDPGSLYAALKLMTQGGELLLFDADGQLVDAARYPHLSPGASWAQRPDGSWTEATTPTPGAPNGG
jgi:hypothetical protein